MKEDARISLHNAKLGYKGQLGESFVINIANLDFFAGDFIGVVGLNGTGKSTLLKSICGLLPLLDGEVVLDGKPLKNIPLFDLAKKISIVLTDRVGGFNLNTYDAVAAGQIPYTDAFHRLREGNVAIINKAIETLGLKGYRNKLLHELSDGLYQKTMIARAIAQQTPSVLLDEPGAFLDYASKNELFILLKRLAEQENKCILVSSHDLDLVLRYCKRVLVVANNTAELVEVAAARSNSAFMEIGGGFI